MRSQTCFLGPEFALEAYQASEYAGYEQPQYKIPLYFHMTKIQLKNGLQ